MTKLLHGVGYNSGGKHKTKIDGVATRSYRAWCSMMDRCYCPLVHRRRPRAAESTVAVEWHDYQAFAEWFNSHPHSNLDYCLDKDILVSGNKIYSPSTCCLIPHEINTLFNDSLGRRGKYLLGVSFDKQKNKFRACIRINGKHTHLGRFNSELEAHLAYVKAKEAHVLHKASEWKGKITDDVYDALRGLYRRQEAAEAEAAEAGE